MFACFVFCITMHNAGEVARWRDGNLAISEYFRHSFKTTAVIIVFPVLPADRGNSGIWTFNGSASHGQSLFSK